MADHLRTESLNHAVAGIGEDLIGVSPRGGLDATVGGIKLLFAHLLEKTGGDFGGGF